MDLIYQHVRIVTKSVTTEPWPYELLFIIERFITTTVL